MSNDPQYNPNSYDVLLARLITRQEDEERTNANFRAYVRTTLEGLVAEKNQRMGASYLAGSFGGAVTTILGFLVYLWKK